MYKEKRSCNHQNENKPAKPGEHKGSTKEIVFLGIIPKGMKMSLLPKKDGFSRPKTIKFRKTRTQPFPLI